MRTPLLIAAASVVALLLAVGVAETQDKPPNADLEIEAIDVDATPLQSFARDGSAPDLGQLVWRGGLVLTSKSPQFGGWSGLLLSPDGTHLVAISDAGTWMTGDITYDGDRPKGLASVKIGPTLGPDGEHLTKGKDRDSEGVTLANGTLDKGTAYISFERHARIGLYDLGADGPGPAQSFLAMPEQAPQMGNDGIEAMTVLKAGPYAGALAAFAESPLPGESEHTGWLWIAGKLKPKKFTVAGIGDYGITDAASLDDGSVLILERRFRIADGVRIRLRRLAIDGLKPDGVASGEVLLEADGGASEIDNLEGLAISHDAAGETVLTIISDDNFNHLMQRNLLLQFTLKDAAAPQDKK